MQIESALFFETVEEIYARVFRILKPRIPLPFVSVNFRKYASATSRVRLANGRLDVSISDLLEGAPAPIQEALAFILLAKLFRKTPERSVVARYQRYLNRADVRRTMHLVRQTRGRKQFLPPQGERFDLDKIFEELNWRYFGGLMARPQLGWSVRASRSTLGHYDPSHHIIVLSKLLDSPGAPSLLVQFVMYHEMLHLKFPTEHRTFRRCVHTAEFKAAEREFDGYDQAKRLLRTFLDRPL